jgi:hypothetical protein
MRSGHAQVCHDVLPDLVTAGSDRGADGGKQLIGLRAEFHHKSVHQRPGHARYGAAPASMAQRNGAVYRIDNRQAGTVGDQDQQCHAGRAGHQPITAMEGAPLGPDACDGCAVDLLRAGPGRWRQAGGGQ